MKYLCFSLFFSLFILLSTKHFSQDSIQSSKNYEVITDYDLLLQRQEKGTLKDIVYKDLSYHFEIKIPEWLLIMEVNSPQLWYGIFQDENNSSHIIGIKLFPKEFESLDVFIKDVFAKIKVAENSNADNSLKLINVEDTGNYKNLGQNFKVISSLQNQIYHCNYVFSESKTAYVWVDFITSEESYNHTVLKFYEFLDNLKIYK